jgi:hypothetical protein
MVPTMLRRSIEASGGLVVGLLDGAAGGDQDDVPHESRVGGRTKGNGPRREAGARGKRRNRETAGGLYFLPALAALLLLEDLLLHDAGGHRAVLEELHRRCWPQALRSCRGALVV